MFIINYGFFFSKMDFMVTSLLVEFIDALHILFFHVRYMIIHSYLNVIIYYYDNICNFFFMMKWTKFLGEVTPSYIDAYTCAQDLGGALPSYICIHVHSGPIYWGVIYLAKKSIRWWYFTCEHVSLFQNPLYYMYIFYIFYLQWILWTYFLSHVVSKIFARDPPEPSSSPSIQDAWAVVVWSSNKSVYAYMFMIKLEWTICFITKSYNETICQGFTRLPWNPTYWKYVDVSVHRLTGCPCPSYVNMPNVNAHYILICFETWCIDVHHDYVCHTKSHSQSGLQKM